jgi:hypothetical protein
METKRLGAMAYSGNESYSRPDIRELVGVAMSASVLAIDPNRGETALLRVAAVGGAANRIALNLDKPAQVTLASGLVFSQPLIAGVARDSKTARVLIGSQPPGDRSRLEAELAPLLWRMKYGRDATAKTALDSIRLFATWLAGTTTWRESPVEANQARRFAARVLHEWIADKCPACAGTGLQELLRNGMTRKPRRYGDPAVRHVKCRGCHGATRPAPDMMARARALEISLSDYRAHWATRMERAGMQLVAISRRLKKPLQSELERDYNRA